MWRTTQLGRGLGTRLWQSVRRPSWRVPAVQPYSSDAEAGVPYRSYEAETGSLREEAPESADVVVMGGGVIGCSTLYHLAKAGVTNAVLVERDQLTSGTTWHTAGLVWGLRPSDLEVELLLRSKALMTSLEAETGLSTGWINNGGLFISSTKERMDEYKRLHSLGKAFGVDSHVLGPEETKKLYPLMNVDDIYATLYSPSDGTIDPAGYCAALTRAAKQRGAKVLQGCSVTGIEVTKDDFGTARVCAVETDRGRIRTDCVVNSAGVWAPKLGAMAGVQVPLVAMRHAYVVTERIEGVQNMPNVRDHDASVYLKLQGDALSVGGYEQNPIFWEKVKDDFAFSLFDLDWDVFSFNIEGSINRVPIIEHTGVKSTVCGPESFTADHKPLMGESPDVRGYFLACGYNSSGMMLSSTASELVKWIINGRPELDMYSYDIRRFPTRLTDNKKWIKERSHESYAKNYSIVFPFDEPLASRNMRMDALYNELCEAGCVYQERHGWERPGWFTKGDPSPPLPYDYYGQYGNSANVNNRYADKLKMDYTFEFPPHHKEIGDACLSCREGVAVFNMSYFGKYYLIGPDAQKAADWIFTNDMTKPIGSTVYTCMLNKLGGTELDLTVSIVQPGNATPYAPDFKEERGFYLAVGGGAAQHGFSYITNIIQDKNFKCRLLDHSEDMALLSVQGPQSRALLQELADTDLGDSCFPFSTHKVLNIAGHAVRALRLSFVGELGWELHVPNVSAVPVYRALMAAGRTYGVVNAGYRAIDSLSLEKGYRHWHADLRSDDSPLEALLGFTCKLKSPTPFLGREALERQKAKGMKKKLVYFTIDENVPLLGLESVWRGDRAVGFLRRGDFAFALGKSMAVGYVTHPDGESVTSDFLRAGDYRLERMGDKMAAQIHLKSPFDPSNKRVRGVYDEPLPIHT